MFKRKLEDCEQKIQDKKTKIIHLDNEIGELAKKEDLLRTEFDKEEVFIHFNIK